MSLAVELTHLHRGTPELSHRKHPSDFPSPRQLAGNLSKSVAPLASSGVDLVYQPTLFSNSSMIFPKISGGQLLVGDAISTWSPMSLSAVALFLVVAVATALSFVRNIISAWWRRHNLRAATDPSSKLGHLPLPPGSFGLPFIGETIAWLREGEMFNANRRNKYGNIFTTNVIGMPMVKVTGHEFVKEILTGEHTKVTTIWPKTVQEILGKNGLINSTAAVHRYKRKVVSKAFSRSALDEYLTAMREISDKNVAAMAERKVPRIYKEMLRLTFDVAVNALLGLDVAKGADLNSLFSSFNDLVSNIFCIPIKIPGLGFVKALKARKKIMDLLEAHIARKKREIIAETNTVADGERVPGQHRGAVDIILREETKNAVRKRDERSRDAANNNSDNIDQPAATEGNDVSIDDLAMKEMAIELMFAGYFTSASGITSCVLELARHPGVRRKVEDELAEHGILRRRGCDDDDITSDETLSNAKLQRLTYLDKVVKETLRLRPPVLGAYRQAVKTFKIKGYRIPKGWKIIYNIRDTHEYEFNDDNQFDPDRFDTSALPRGDNKYRYIPFGSGPRMCIGQDYARLILKMTLVQMFRHYRSWELLSNPKMSAIPTLHPKDGLPVKLFRRRVVGCIESEDR